MRLTVHYVDELLPLHIAEGPVREIYAYQVALHMDVGDKEREERRATLDWKLDLKDMRTARAMHHEGVRCLPSIIHEVVELRCFVRLQERAILSLGPLVSIQIRLCDHGRLGVILRDVNHHDELEQHVPVNLAYMYILGNRAWKIYAVVHHTVIYA